MGENGAEKSGESNQEKKSGENSCELIVGKVGKSGEIIEKVEKLPIGRNNRKGWKLRDKEIIDY